MMAPSVMAPGTPSTGPGLKLKDRSLAWTSLASSRRSGVWFGAGSTGACWLPVAGTGSIPPAGKGPAEARLTGGGSGDGATNSGGAAAGWLSAAGAACAAASSTVEEEGTLAGGDGDAGTGEGDIDSGGAGAGAVVAISISDGGSGRAAVLGDGGTGHEPTVG